MALRLDQPVTFQRLGSGANLMEVPRDQAIALVKKYTLAYDPYLGDMLYSLESMGNTGAISFMNFVGPKHVFQPRVNACAWRPKGKFKTQQTTLTLDPIEVNMSQCPDAFYGGPWERIFGTGVDIANLMASEAGRMLMDEILRLIYVGQGNDIHDMVDFGRHPVISIADANGYFSVAADEWADYTDQQAAVGGRMTLVDGLKTDGLDHYNVDITAYINTVTGAFTGDIFDFLDKVIAGRRTEFKIAESQLQNGGVKGIIELDEVTFAALGSQLLDRFNNIPELYQLFINGVAGALDTARYLRYKGYAVKNQTGWSQFDAITGTITRRALLSYPKVHGIGYDIPNLDEYSGIGLRVEQSPLLRDKGRIDMFGALKIGTAIIDTNFCVNASATLFPPFIA
jgi:hypothetical protein